jgi:uncharacterized protein YdhG (YjbR/CyaY superfamily)
MPGQPENSTDAYIAACPPDVQAVLSRFRAVIREVAPDAVERTDYFQFPGYSYEGYDYNGMFVWFSYRNDRVRLHLRPPTIEDHKQELVGAKLSTGIASFAVDQAPDSELVALLVRSSLDTMRGGSG